MSTTAREPTANPRAPSPPPLAQVRKEDFDNAIKSAQEALRAKTSSSQMMLEQASSAMRNAVSALSLSEQEVANLRAVVKELKEGQDGASGNEAVNRERAQLRAAQQRVQELSQNFRALQNEVARMRYEQEGVDMPVAAKFPVRIDPMLSSKVVVIAQLVMLGYSYADSEDAVDAVRVHDTELALEWLEGRNVRKTSTLPVTQTQRAPGDDRFKLGSAAHKQAVPRFKPEPQFMVGSAARHDGDAERETVVTHAHTPGPDLLKGPTSPRASTSPRSILPSVRQSHRPLDPEFANAAKHRRPEHRGPYNAADLYRARKRAVTVLSECAENPPPGLSRPNQLRRQTDAMAALTRLTEGVGAHLLVQLGCIRVATRVMQREANNKRVVLLCLDMIRGLLVNPLSMVHAARSRGFEEMPRAICQVVDKYYADDMDACGAAAATLWPAATIGKRPAQDAIVDAGAVDFIARALCRPKSDDPSGANVRKLIGCLLALAIRNARVQETMVKARVRALIRKGLVEHAHISFKGEFSALRDWTKDEFTNPTPLPNGVTVDPSGYKPPSRKASSPPGSPQAKRGNRTQNAPNSMLKSPDSETRGSRLGRKAPAPAGPVAERLGLKPDEMYLARKQAVTMLSAMAVNPPGKKSGLSPRESEETAYRCLLALAKLSARNSAYIVLTNGGPRAAIDCLRLYPANMDVTYAAFKVLRGLLGNPSTMMKLRKQKRFRIIPAAVVDGVYRHDSLDVRAEAAHCLWTYSGVGGVDAQDLVIGVDFLPVLKSGLEEARAMDKGRSDARVRKFVGCTLALAKGNEPVQDLLVAEGMRALLRKSLVEFKTITFNGEFTELRDWIRGDRGGAKSATKSRESPNERRAAELRLAEDERLQAAAAAGRSVPGGGFKTPDAGRRMMSTRQERERLRREDEAAMRTPTNVRVPPGGDLNERFVAPSTLDRVGGRFGDEPASVASKPAARPDASGVGARFTPKPGSSGGSWSVESAVLALDDKSDARRHPAATEALAEMFAASPASGVDIVMRGGIGALAHAVDVSPADGSYAPGGLALIHALASADATSRRVKADESVKSGRALVAVLDAMDRFARDERTQQWGAMALWATCRDNPRAKASLIRSSRLRSGKSPAAVLLAALEFHGEQSEPIAKACIGAMLCVATNEPEFQSELAAVGAPRRILETLETHRNMSFAGEFDALREWLRECAR